jgi:hypothetical protein
MTRNDDSVPHSHSSCGEATCEETAATAEDREGCAHNEAEPCGGHRPASKDSAAG